MVGPDLAQGFNPVNILMMDIAHRVLVQPQVPFELAADLGCHWHPLKLLEGDRR